MQSSEWTSDRLQDRIQDHLSWVVAVSPNGSIQTRNPQIPLSLRFKNLVRNSVQALPFGATVLMTALRAVKAWLRTRRPSSGR